MHSFPRINVIIPVYNCENYIAEAIDSILDQKYPELRIVLVNDGSTDSSPSICDSYARLYPQIHVIHQSNGGVSAARNAALEYLLEPSRFAKSDYVAFLDADDKWYPDFFDESIMPLFGQGIHLIGFQSARCNHSVVRYKTPPLMEEGIFCGGVSAVWKNNSHFGSAFYSLSVINEFSLRFPDKLKINEDIIFSMQFKYLADKVYLKNRILYLYRNNQSSVSHKRRNAITKYVPIIDAYLKSDLCMQQYQNSYRGQLKEGSAMAAVYIVDVHEEHYRQFGSSKELRQMMINHPEYLSLITSPSFYHRSDSGLRWQMMNTHPWRFRIKCYAKGASQFVFRFAYLSLVKIPIIAGILDKYRYHNEI